VFNQLGGLAIATLSLVRRPRGKRELPAEQAPLVLMSSTTIFATLAIGDHHETTAGQSARRDSV